VLFIAAGGLLAPASLTALWHRRFRLARVLGAAQVVVLLSGWGAAQWPYLVYPDLTISGSAAPRATLALTLWTLPFGFGVLVPSLWFLFSVFKGRKPVAR
jgi:cytochrome d ubiquinol oxidase subunit II